jgi:hypothetical protein
MVCILKTCNKFPEKLLQCNTLFVLSIYRFQKRGVTFSSVDL